MNTSSTHSPILSFNQDSQVAFKIFELGLKKYGNVPEYILAYVDYLSHLNGEYNKLMKLFSLRVWSGCCVTLPFVKRKPKIM